MSKVKPESLSVAVKNLEAILPKTMNVGSGYGIDKDQTKEDASWRLYVWTDDKDVSMIPDEFEGSEYETLQSEIKEEKLARIKREIEFLNAQAEKLTK